MSRTLIFSILIAMIYSGTVNAQQLPAQPVISGEWIKTWLICGPIPLQDSKDASESLDHLQGFDTDYLKKAGGEQNLQVKAGDGIKFSKGSAQWKFIHSNDSNIDLARLVSKESPVFSYAYTEIQADESKVWFVGLGTNDGGKLWVNGLNVWDYQPARGLVPDDDLIPVLLKKGTNTLLLKIEQRGNRWGFCARPLSFSTASLADRGELFTITAGKNETAGITSTYSATVLDQLIQNLSIEIFNSQNQPVLKEQRTSGFCGNLNLKSDAYQPYRATIDIQLKSGENIKQKVSFAAGKRINYTLFSGLKSAYRISLSPQASESEQWAAKELQHWINEISGVELPIQNLNPASTEPQIIIGYNSEIKEKTGANAPEDLDESFRYCNSGADILIYGGKMRGTMYGVMAFLENELGCRWYTPTVSVIPKKKEFNFTWLDHSEKPGIRVRNDFYFEAFDPIWAARNRMNGTLGFAESRKQPGGMESYWAVHTFYPLMPPEEFFGKHPEYYSLIDGKRIFDHAQLCLTNPDVLKIITERIKKRMSESPEYLIYDVSQNDWYNPCQCEKCQAIVSKEGSESGLIIWFVNQVAESVEKEFPDKFIGTLAYQYTRTPPKTIRPRDNVVVRLCSIECCFSHDFKTCPENQSFLSDLQKWSALAPHLYIWDYVVNFSHYVMPYPNFKVLQSNIQTFRENNSIGIMEQASYQSRGGEFSELRAYLISRLLWNPDGDVEKVINDFMYGYYGRAGQLIRRYFDILQNRVTPVTHIHLGLAPDDPVFSDEFVTKSCEIFEEAAKVADNEEILHRVEMASLPVLYLKCKRTPVLAKYDGSYAKFCAIAKREGVTHYAEAGEPHRKAFHKSVESAK
ncbi:MAG: DUF4838 domain-containing protein [Bacteroidota bacterium]|nr:DUF4838 domain-containing protein [Bacteroidota bacterium]